jgi:hypothetical protein
MAGLAREEWWFGVQDSTGSASASSLLSQDDI